MDTDAKLFWQATFLMGKLQTGQLKYQVAFNTFKALESFCKTQPTDEFVTAQYMSPLYSQLALLYCECLAVKNAIELAEAAVLFFEVEGNVS
jgi:hypothetical protein